MSSRFLALLLIVNLGISSAQAQENPVRNFLGGILGGVLEPGEPESAEYADDGETPSDDAPKTTPPKK